MVSYHYRTKAGLWRAVLSHLNQIWNDRYSDRLSGLRGVDDVTTLRLLLEEFIAFGGEHPEFHWLMSDAAREHTERLDWLVQDGNSYNVRYPPIIVHETDYLRPSISRNCQLATI